MPALPPSIPSLTLCSVRWQARTDFAKLGRDDSDEHHSPTTIIRSSIPRVVIPQYFYYSTIPRTRPDLPGFAVQPQHPTASILTSRKQARTKPPHERNPPTSKHEAPPCQKWTKPPMLVGSIRLQVHLLGRGHIHWLTSVLAASTLTYSCTSDLLSSGHIQVLQKKRMLWGFGWKQQVYRWMKKADGGR
jgi:hypothetical protein